MAKVYIPKRSIKVMGTVYYPDGGKTGREVNAIYPTANCIYNAGLYSTSNHESITKMKVDGKMIGYWGAWEGYGVLDSKNLIWCSYDDAKNNSRITSWIAGSPVLLKDSRIELNWGDLYSEYVNGDHDRCIMCDNNSNLMILSISDLINPKEEAERIKKYMYAINGINLDGGSSTEIWFKGKRLCGTDRKNATWIVIYS